VPPKEGRDGSRLEELIAALIARQREILVRFKRICTPQDDRGAVGHAELPPETTYPPPVVAAGCLLEEGRRLTVRCPCQDSRASLTSRHIGNPDGSTTRAADAAEHQTVEVEHQWLTDQALLQAGQHCCNPVLCFGRLLLRPFAVANGTTCLNFVDWLNEQSISTVSIIRVYQNGRLLLGKGEHQCIRTA
jgi:hypothetical protein